MICDLMSYTTPMNWNTCLGINSDFPSSLSIPTPALGSILSVCTDLYVGMYARASTNRLCKLGVEYLMAARMCKTCVRACQIHPKQSVYSTPVKKRID